MLQRTASETTTVWQLARRLEREAAWAEKEKCQRALVRRQQHQLSIERVAVPIIRGTVPYPVLRAVKQRNAHAIARLDPDRITGASNISGLVRLHAATPSALRARRTPLSYRHHAVTVRGQRPV